MLGSWGLVIPRLLTNPICAGRLRTGESAGITTIIDPGLWSRVQTARERRRTRTPGRIVKEREEAGRNLAMSRDIVASGIERLTSERLGCIEPRHRGLPNVAAADWCLSSAELAEVNALVGG